jgi:hypothetical protein
MTAHSMRLVGLIILATLPVLAGCGRAVTVAPAGTSPVGAVACEALQSQLPARLADQPRLAVTPDEGTTAAWGTPAIVWRCGVGKPGALEPTSQLITVDGTDWFPEELTDGFRFTTVGVSPATELTVPKAYPNAASLLTALPIGPLVPSTSPD